MAHIFQMDYNAPPLDDEVLKETFPKWQARGSWWRNFGHRDRDFLVFFVN